MKKHVFVKYLSCALAVITLALAIASCSGTDNKSQGGTEKPAGTESDVTDKPKAEANFEAYRSAAAEAVAANDSAEFVPREESYIENFISIVPSDYENCTILISTEGGSISEYGVIEASDEGEAKTLKSAIEDYFNFYRDDLWDDRYLPEEYPKLRDAEVRIFGGRFVIYAIMDEDGRDAVFTAAEKL